MFFWDIKRLVRLLIERDLTETEAFQYFFANWVLITLVVGVPEPKWNMWDGLVTLTSVTFTIAGLLYCFVANGGGAGQSFLPRMMAVMWVVTLRVMAGFLLIVMVIYGVQEALGDVGDETTWVDAMLMAATEALLYWRISVHIKRIRMSRHHNATAAGQDAVAAVVPVHEN